MNRKTWLTALMVGSLSAPARAADWLSIQGLEPADPEKSKLRPFGFVQVSGEAIFSDPVEGLTSEALAVYNGQRAAFNTYGSDQRTWQVSLRRVRIGTRGAIPGTNGLIDTFITVELGQNALTTTGSDGWRPKLMDASVTFNNPLGVHLRMGQFKVPTSNEALEAVHLTTDLIRATAVTSRLLMERNAATGVFTGRVNGHRDIGIQAFGSHLAGKWELSWAAMASNGSVDLTTPEPGVDVTGRFQVSMLYDEQRRNPWREELSAWGFVTTGERNVGEDEVARRLRAGGGVQLVKHGARIRSEFVWADGVLNVGQSPPFQGGTLQVSPDGQAWGVTGLASMTFASTWEAGIAYSHLDSLPHGGAARRVFNDTTAFGQVHISKNARFELNLSWRDAKAPLGSDDAKTILATKGPYAGLMVTASL